IEEYNLKQNAKDQGNNFIEQLRDRNLPEYAHNPRNKGLMMAVDFDTKKRRDAVLEACLNRGLLILGCGSRTVRILPPLDVTEREISIGAEIFCDAVTDPSVRNIAE
ncbi:MAG: aminotransferase class III-fold pyridoxal phosphate-dependent enzyme, partial [Halobacteriaceae archaeon]